MLQTPTRNAEQHETQARLAMLGGSDPAVYQDLAKLAAVMPDKYREMFTLRWLDESPHSLAQIGAIVGLAPAVVGNRLEMCLWNCHRLQHNHQLPAIDRMLGHDRREWTARAWAQSSRWPTLASRMAETRLLLAIAGMDIPQIQQIIGDHLVKIGVLAVSPWGAPLTRRQRTELARPVVDRLLEHSIWPDTPKAPWTPEAFEPKRTIGTHWSGLTRCGYFHSQKLDRNVMYESPLEREMLRHLDADDRVIDIREQPFTLPVHYDGREHTYTPDAIVLLDDGRTVVIEVKGQCGMAQFPHWMRWHALERDCERSGHGLYIGNTQTGSIIDHYHAGQNSPYRDLVRTLADEGAAVGSDNRLALHHEDHVQFAQAITAEMLAWIPGPKGGIRTTTGIDRDKASAFWRCVVARPPKLQPPPSPPQL